jgi:hypothetical protein
MVRFRKTKFVLSIITNISEDGSFIGFGYNLDSRLGTGSLSGDVFEPISLPLVSQYNFTTLACGGWHTLGLMRNGVVYGWGNFIGDYGFVKEPMEITDLEGHIICRLFCFSSSSICIAVSNTRRVFVFGQSSKILAGIVSDSEDVLEVENLKGLDICNASLGYDSACLIIRNYEPQKQNQVL